ncbi:hypothetical protein AYO21_04409 [Fonsecaea monophora]|uniref:Uncharacterized protein n=1 Tax=Fonsecaea monophora TaxID=254056 RepID=A0A177FB11_9EURO|nr:hypothetical protein AYO21_04409 [Fonsecaea monophora]KAH0848383.1 hypothetical protein FOPE_02234 [Fonsecaea pedrosoi]OAG41467.1 hypothetical protein AYO21_04409 [Fonsecaea monophora]
MAAHARRSRTFFDRQEMPPHLQLLTESQRGTSAPITSQDRHGNTPFRTPPDTESLDSTLTQHAIQDARSTPHDRRMVDHEIKTLEHDAQIQAISSVLETFRNTLDEIKTSIEELKAQTSPPRLDKPTQIDFAGNIRTMIMTLTSAQANAQELEELRAENAALRAKWDIVQSAMITATGQSTPSSSYEVPHKNSLGKRKRDTSVAGSSALIPVVGALQTRSHHLETVSSSTQMPTPQSSNHSDGQSADDSNSSRISTPEQEAARSNSQNILDYSDQFTNQDRVPSRMTSLRRSLKGRLLSESHQHTEIASLDVGAAPVEMSSADTQASSKNPDTHENQQQPIPGSVGYLLRSSSRRDDSRESILAGPARESEDNEDRPQECRESDYLEENNRLRDRNDAPSLDIDPLDTSEILSSIEKGADFGENSGVRSSAFMDTLNGTTNLDVQPSNEVSAVDELSAQSVPARRIRSKTAGPSTRSKIDFIMDSRSVAPEPAALRRTIPRRLCANQEARFEHATPESIEQELKVLENPKGRRKSKPHVQTTKKILDKELKELGLEEWIGKDKDDPEYKRVVEEARDRKREQMRLAALARRGISLPGAPEDDERAESTSTLQEAFTQASDALTDSTNEGNGGKQIQIINVSEAAARRAKGSGTCRKKREQREEEIRRRDMLAKEAMDMND